MRVDTFHIDPENSKETARVNDWVSLRRGREEIV